MQQEKAKIVLIINYNKMTRESKIQRLNRMLQFAAVRYQEEVAADNLNKANDYLYLINKYNSILTDIETKGYSEYVTL